MPLPVAPSSLATKALVPRHEWTRGSAEGQRAGLVPGDHDGARVRRARRIEGHCQRPLLRRIAVAPRPEGRAAGVERDHEDIVIGATGEHLSLDVEIARHAAGDDDVATGVDRHARDRDVSGGGEGLGPGLGRRAIARAGVAGVAGVARVIVVGVRRVGSIAGVGAIRGIAAVVRVGSIAGVARVGGVVAVLSGVSRATVEAGVGPRRQLLDAEDRRAGRRRQRGHHGSDDPPAPPEHQNEPPAEIPNTPGPATGVTRTAALGEGVVTHSTTAPASAAPPTANATVDPWPSESAVTL